MGKADSYNCLQVLIVISYLNDTWIYNSTDGFCDPVTGGTSQDFCITYRGGLYDLTASSTSELASSVYASGGDPSDIQRTGGTHIWESTWAKDLLSFGHTSFSAFPIGMPSYEYANLLSSQTNIGLGKNSTLLTRLQSAGQITSRSWSWWWGRTSPTEGAPMDGSIVFGGYDKAKTNGNGYTQNLIRPEVNCQSGMRVTISDLSLGFPNGTVASILGKKQISACLQPDYPVVMTLPQDPYYSTFESLTGTRSIDGGNVTSLGAGPLYDPGEV